MSTEPQILVILELIAAVKVDPVIDQQQVSPFLAKLYVQLARLGNFFEKIHRLYLLGCEIGCILRLVGPLNQNPQKTTCKMPLAEGEDRLTTIGLGVPPVDIVPLVEQWLPVPSGR